MKMCTYQIEFFIQSSKFCEFLYWQLITAIVTSKYLYITLCTY
jgi:hypothetical protein